jgi:hypothetical protein
MDSDLSRNLVFGCCNSILLREGICSSKTRLAAKEFLSSSAYQSERCGSPRNSEPYADADHLLPALLYLDSQDIWPAAEPQTSPPGSPKGKPNSKQRRNQFPNYKGAASEEDFERRQFRE